MTVRKTEALDRESEQGHPSSPVAPTGFALVAKRITRWTTNCLLTAIILVIGLGFGRQVIIWWGADLPAGDSPSAPAILGDGLGDPSLPHILQFGDQPGSIERQVVAGSSKDALRALRATCRRLVGQAKPVDGPPNEQERRFLAGLVGEKPVDEQPGRWQIYQRTDGFPMVVGVQTQPKGSKPLAGDKLAETTSRVVIWGLAIPMGTKGWTLYIFQPQGGTVSPEGFPEVPLPPDAKRLISMRVAGGGAIIAFTSPEQLKVSMRFYDRWFAQRNGKVLQAWQSIGSAWHGQYLATESNRTATIDIRVDSPSQGPNTGLIVITPSGSQTKN